MHSVQSLLIIPYPKNIQSFGEDPRLKHREPPAQHPKNTFENHSLRPGAQPGTSVWRHPRHGENHKVSPRGLGQARAHFAFQWSSWEFPNKPVLDILTKVGKRGNVWGTREPGAQHVANDRTHFRIISKRNIPDIGTAGTAPGLNQSIAHPLTFGSKAVMEATPKHRFPHTKKRNHQANARILVPKKRNTKNKRHKPPLG